MTYFAKFKWHFDNIIEGKADPSEVVLFPKAEFVTRAVGKDSVLLRLEPEELKVVNGVFSQYYTPVDSPIPLNRDRIFKQIYLAIRFGDEESALDILSRF